MLKNWFNSPMLEMTQLSLRKLVATCILILVSPGSYAFDIELTRNNYLPAELMEIKCKWPKNPPTGHVGQILFKPYEQLANGGRGEAVLPWENFSYASRFGKQKCAELRAPMAPGRYVLEVTVDAETPITRTVDITVSELPAEDGLLKHVGTTDAREGKMYEFHLTLPGDRCYPATNTQISRHQPVLVAVVERKRREIVTTNGYLVANTCLGECGEPVVRWTYCKSTGTWAHNILVPKKAGFFDLNFLQQVTQRSECGSDCVVLPNENEQQQQYFRVLDTLALDDPPEVEKIYFSRDLEGKDRIEANDIIGDRFVAWVKFKKPNPFEFEYLEVAGAADSTEPMSIELVRVNESDALYTSRYGFVDSKVVLEGIANGSTRVSP